jgi:hypothetical protein
MDQVALQLRSPLLRGVHPIDALPLWLLRMRTCAHPMVTTQAGSNRRNDGNAGYAPVAGSEGY